MPLRQTTLEFLIQLTGYNTAIENEKFSPAQFIVLQRSHSNVDCASEQVFRNVYACDISPANNPIKVNSQKPGLLAPLFRLLGY